MSRAGSWLSLTVAGVDGGRKHAPRLPGVLRTADAAQELALLPLAPATSCYRTGAISNEPSGSPNTARNDPAMSTPITVIGNVTRNPQLSRTNSGTPVVNLTLAENHRRQVEGEWVDGAVTHWEIVCFDERGLVVVGHGIADDHARVAVDHRGQTTRRRHAEGLGADRSWRVGADGEVAIAQVLAELTEPSRWERLRGRGPGWRVLHSCRWVMARAGSAGTSTTS